MRKNMLQNLVKKGGIADEIAQLKARRDERKLKEEKKSQNNQNNQHNPNDNQKIKQSDPAFEKMMTKKKLELQKSITPSQYTAIKNSKIFVVVRKRPLSKKEIANGEIDCVSVYNPRIYVHECKIQVDGITKYLEDHEFYFDNSFGENASTKDVYNYTINPMIDLVLNEGIVTCFAYGQTGSGKTYTMKGIESYAIDALYANNMDEQFDFYISFFEIYGGRLFDLLNSRTVLQVLDDKNGKVQIYGLVNILAESPSQMHSIIDSANNVRTTHNTVTNETSSRSHAICNIVVKLKGSDEEYGKLSLVDLAGSERAQETQSNNRQRRAEGAEINKSLLALKECIRALDERKNNNPEQHVPFRASKLTHVLRDSFVSKSDRSKIIMISCVSPSYSSANHSINTLRYSDRLKEQTKMHGVDVNNNRGLMINNNNNALKNNNMGGNNLNNINNANNVNNNKYGINSNNNKPSTRGKLKDSKIAGAMNNNKNYKNANVNNALNNKKNEIDFNDRMDIDLEDENEIKNLGNNNNGQIKNSVDVNNDEDDWDYMKKTAKIEGRIIDDNFIKYNQLLDKIVQEEDDIVNSHMEVIKEDAKMLTEEGNLISIMKGVQVEEDFKVDDYMSGLEDIIAKKLKFYTNLKNRIDSYKQMVKFEDELRKKINPKYFSDNNL